MFGNKRKIEEMDKRIKFVESRLQEFEGRLFKTLSHLATAEEEIVRLQIRYEAYMPHNHHEQKTAQA